MLMPPLVKSYMPAFDCSKNSITGNANSVKIYFLISSYNTQNKIRNVQIVVRHQSDNSNALKTSSYPNSIKVCSLLKQDANTGDPVIASSQYKYYVILSSNDLTNGFEAGSIYKIQLRFSSKDVTSSSSPSELSGGASEWSTVCLIKPIIAPTVQVVGLAQYNEKASQKTVTVLNSLQSVFTIVYKPNTTSQSLRYWQVKLYNEDKTTLLSQTGMQSANNYQSSGGNLSFQAQLKYQMSSNSIYMLQLYFQTKNGYSQTKYYQFRAIANASSRFDGTVTAKIVAEDGYVDIQVVNNEITNANLVLRRTSSQSNFTLWEDISNKLVHNSTVSWQYKDFTIQSDVFYQYGVQFRDIFGRRSGMTVSDKVMCQFQDAFLTQRSGSTDDAIQLKIKYDMAISNAAVNVGQSRIETIGSKYPFVRRNGNMYYHSFPFSFLITAYQDDSHIFATRKQLTNDLAELYSSDAYGGPKFIQNGKYDYFYEREFRQKVEKFLYNNKVKLFRSLTQGNMLIKLMDITLTPKQELGRLLYSVDATAIEIDDASIEKLDSYGIINIGTYSTVIAFEEVQIGQISNFTTQRIYDSDTNSYSYVNSEEAFPANFDLMKTKYSTTQTRVAPDNYRIDAMPDSIYSKYGFQENSSTGLRVTDLYLLNLRIEIDSPPYLIKDDNGVLSPLGDDQAPDENTLLGSLVTIGDTTILIEQPNTIYQMKGDDVHIGSDVSITVPKPTKLILDYVVHLSKEVNTEKIVAAIQYKNINGQLCGTFETGEDLVNTIKYKYYLDLYDTKLDDRYYTQVDQVNTMNVEANYHTVFYAQSTVQTSPVRFVIGETNELFIDPNIDNASIKMLYFYGLNIDLDKMNDCGDSAPEAPKEFDYYTKNGTVMIFHDGKWYAAAAQDNGNSYDIACPVDAIVNYYILTEKGTY